MSAVLQLTEQLIAQASVTPEDADCQKILAARLQACNFDCETIISGPEDFRVKNLWAKRISPLPQAGMFVFVGHTDVVPTGPVDRWSSDPFTPSHRNGKLFGRGASDMKSSLAAMVVACEQFLAGCSQPAFNLAMLLTSDEEGPALDGTVAVCKLLKQRGEKLDWCLVGEPTSVNTTGDMIKNGRRGTLSGKLKIKGIQGHIAYPQLARNPIHSVAPALAELVAMEWDQGNAFFPPTSWQISNIHAGTGAGNVIPGECVIDFNFRFCTESTVESLQQRLTSILDRHQLEYELGWVLGGLPFLTTPGDWVDVVKNAIEIETGIQTELSTSGGTSDGRFMAQICPQVIELGPPNDSIHKIDEHIKLTDLETLARVYLQILQQLQSRESQRLQGLNN
jgi:succinyl-diaminopimelate desuccinylase